MKRFRKALTLLPGVLLMAASVFLNAATAPRAAAASIHPSDFVNGIDNPYFPLKPGTTFVYQGKSPDGTERDVMTVTSGTKVIEDVVCVVVTDKGYTNGVLTESTFDWYAQDEDGNVWYFGEDTRELDAKGNVVSTEGSWEAGVDGARPGIIMEAHPQVGDSYRQELARGVAEDMAEVVSLTASTRTPFGSFQGTLLKTRETTRLEPGLVEYKFYARGVGDVYETTSDGTDWLKLVEVRHGD